MRHFIIFLGFILIWTSYSFSQQVDDKKSFDDLKLLRLKVIKDSVVGKKYYYDFTKEVNCNKTCISYLGQIKTDKNKIYKILTCFYVHGQSCRGTSRMVIYNLKNEYIGNYYMSMPNDLPDTIINNNLVYSKANLECKFRKGTKISFKNGLPETIFIPCDKANNGDLYSFSNNE